MMQIMDSKGWGVAFLSGVLGHVQVGQVNDVWGSGVQVKKGQVQLGKQINKWCGCSSFILWFILFDYDSEEQEVCVYVMSSQ